MDLPQHSEVNIVCDRYASDSEFITFKKCEMLFELLLYAEVEGNKLFY